jgi:hypothetical protein
MCSEGPRGLSGSRPQEDVIACGQGLGGLGGYGGFAGPGGNAASGRGSLTSSITPPPQEAPDLNGAPVLAPHASHACTQKQELPNTAAQ